LAINEINLPYVESVLTATINGLYLEPRAFSAYFLLLPGRGGEVNKQLGGHLALSKD